MLTDSKAPLSVRANIIAEQLEKPDLDNRSYRVIQLPNKLEVLLVHDPDTDKASAALDVHAGNFSDKDDLPGQAHAVEHLLFMGTKKYPRENEYSQYLAEHSGYSNAYTAATSTNYFFEVGHEHFYGALDRFAQFFIAPLFLAETLDRELRAVDSENKKNLQADTWRLNQLAKSLSNPAHPYCHFSTGNLQTLKEIPAQKGVNVRDEFLRFHEKYYSANVMKLVVLGREDLDTLENWVVELFKDVKNKDLPDPRFGGQPFTEKELLTQYFAKPVMDTRYIEIWFPFLSEEQLYRTMPSRYVAHLVGHEGPGSILAYLKKKGWANSLTAGASPVCSDAAFFYITVKLTEEGLENYEEVVKTVFQYINIVKTTPVQEWVMRELQAVAAIDFKFRQKSPASKFTSRISSVMQRPLPREWLLSGTSLIREYDPEHIRQSLEYLRPDNFRLSVVSRTCARGEFDSQEKWYGTEYRVEDLPEKFLKEIESTAGPDTGKGLEKDLHLPKRNEFIPTNFEVHRKEVEKPSKVPVLIRNTDLIRVWWKKDDTFWVPKANVFATLRNPLVDASPRNAVMSRLYCELVKDALNEYAYDAEIAGLDYTLSCHTLGLDIEVYGYNDKMSVLLEKVVTKMRDLEINPDRFRVLKDRTLRGYRNWYYAVPYYQIAEFANYLHTWHQWLNGDHLRELESVTVEEVESFWKAAMRSVHIEALVHGNLYKEDALKMTHLIESTLKAEPLPQNQFRIRRSLMIPPGGKYVWPQYLKDEKNVNSCIEYSLYIGEHTDRKLRALTILFAQMSDEPAFDQLRTKEQLGYVVFSGLRVNATTFVYRVLIQSERSAPYLESRIEVFLKEYGERLEKMSEKEVKVHINSAIAKKTEKLKNLNQETSRLWNYIASEYYDFMQIDAEVELLRGITKAELVDFFKRYIDPASPTRSKVSVHLNAIAKPPTPDMKEQKKVLTTAVSQFLATKAGIYVDSSALDKRFENVDPAEIPAIVSAIETYLVQDAKLEADKVKALISQGPRVLEKLLPTLLESKDAGHAEEELLKGQGDIIEDVWTFKAGLMATKGARPVRPLVEFEENGVKL
ncbi:metalloprotease [Rhizina undulata]